MTELQTIFIRNSRGLAILRQRDQTLHTFRKTGENVEIYDQKTKSWVDCSTEILVALNFEKQDLLIGLGNTISAL